MTPDTDSPTWRAELYARLIMEQPYPGALHDPRALPRWLRIQLPEGAPLTSALPGPSARLISACRHYLAPRGYRLEVRHYDRIDGRPCPHVAMRARKIEPRKGEDDAQP